MKVAQIIDKLNEEKAVTTAEWLQLLSHFDAEDQEYAASLARYIACGKFGKRVFFRGIIEFTNCCRNDCLYCGIRCSNKIVSRYRLTQEDILACCQDGYRLGYRTFVLQGGEDMWYTDERMAAIVSAIHDVYRDCAITLSIGERERDSYVKLFQAGAERYLLRHETADETHYHKLHPLSLSWTHRMKCLQELKEIGYQTGCGMMVGSPYQEIKHLVEDMQFMCAFQPHMIGIGPFIPHQQTPFAKFPAGNENMTLFLLSLCRIMLPDVLLPATTALGTVEQDGRQRGILAGCNVIMPNLSPLSVRTNYLLYDNKVGIHDTAEEGIRKLKEQMQAIGYEIVIGRGDHPSC